SRTRRCATQAKRCVLEYDNTPTPANLSEADADDADGFLEEMLLSSTRSECAFPRLTSGFTTGHCALRVRGPVPGEWKPRRICSSGGSTAVQIEVASCHAYLVKLRKALLDNGVLT